MAEGMRLFKGEVRRSSLTSLVVMPALLVTIELVLAALKLQGTVLRDGLDLFGQTMMSPLAPLLPLVAALSGSLSLLGAVRSRYVSAARTRVGPSSLVLAYLASGALAAFAPLFLSTVAVGAFAFFMWPGISPELINPTVYDLSPATVQQDALGRVSLSQLLAGGRLAYSLTYSAWVGLAAAVFATMGNVLILVLRMPLVAFFLPLGLYVGQSVLAGLVDLPQWGALFAVFPFGLVQQPLGAAVAPIVAVAVVVALTTVFAARRASALSSLT